MSACLWLADPSSKLLFPLYVDMPRTSCDTAQCKVDVFETEGEKGEVFSGARLNVGGHAAP